MIRPPPRSSLFTSTALFRFTSGTNPTTLAGFGITDGASNSLNSANFFVGNGANVATGVAMSGDATINNTDASSLASIGTAGPYFKVTTDAKGRVTSGNDSLA